MPLRVLRRHSEVLTMLALIGGLTAGCSTGGDPKGSAHYEGAPLSANRVDAARHPIVYSQARGHQLDLYLASPSGGDPLQLTANGADEVMADWSPDGRTIAFVETSDIDEGPNVIYTVSSDGTGLRRLTPEDTCSSDPSWAPDGEAIAYVQGCGDDPQVAVMDADGGNPRPLIGTVSYWPDWSSDGRIVFVGPAPAGDAEAIYLKAPGRRQRAIDIGRLQAASEPAWSPDAQQIAFVSPVGSPNSPDAADWDEDIFVTDADSSSGTSGVTHVVSTPGDDHWPPAWSPDGQQLLYTADGKGSGSTLGTLMLVDVDAHTPLPLPGVTCPCVFPDWRR